MRQTRRGNQAIEFALLMPILLVFIGGVVDYGIYLNQRMSVTMVARDAARAGSLVRVGGGNVEAAAEAQGTASLAVAGMTGTVDCALTGISPDQAIRCDVDVPYVPLLDLVPLPAALETNLTMRMEEQP